MSLATMLVAPLADTLAMDMRVDENLLLGGVMGTKKRELGLLQGFPVTLDMVIIDSFVDDRNNISQLLVHCGGDVYLIVSYDCSHSLPDNLITVYVVDGSKLWTSKSPLLFPKNYSRKELYEKIVGGLKASYFRRHDKINWHEFMSPKTMRDYLHERSHSGRSSSMVMQELVPVIWENNDA